MSAPNCLTKLAKLDLDGAVWVASDIHLGPAIPKTNAHFYDFLARADAEADALILLGDIFDFWIGDDIAITHATPGLAEACHHLRQFAQAKPLYLVHGNRDFLLGDAFGQHINAQLLPPQLLLNVGPTRLILSHGDELCTDDHAFMRFRYWTRQRWLQRAFLALPVAWRLAVAQRARQGSKGNDPNYLAISDVTHSAVHQVLAQHPDVAGLMHGHTHRPQRHRIEYQQRQYERIVLPDWDYDNPPYRSGYAVVTATGVELIVADSNGETVI